mmetsp:Transcript_44284/g.139053  ORF Transcript_44284/g.139053 Transcript_44284/m.139053 type:complete len:93 (+) Transcript_44284:643-921(+)
MATTAEYWIPAGRVAAFATTMMLPVAAINKLALALRGRLDESVAVSTSLRAALALHSLYCRPSRSARTARRTPRGRPSSASCQITPTTRSGR